MAARTVRATPVFSSTSVCEHGPVPQELLPAPLPEVVVGVVLGREPQPRLVADPDLARARVAGRDERVVALPPDPDDLVEPAAEPLPAVAEQGDVGDQARCGPPGSRAGRAGSPRRAGAGSSPARGRGTRSGRSTSCGGWAASSGSRGSGGRRRPPRPPGGRGGASRSSRCRTRRGSPGAGCCRRRR